MTSWTLRAEHAKGARRMGPQFPVGESPMIGGVSGVELTGPSKTIGGSWTAPEIHARRTGTMMAGRPRHTPWYLTTRRHIGTMVRRGHDAREVPPPCRSKYGLPRIPRQRPSGVGPPSQLARIPAIFGKISASFPPWLCRKAMSGGPSIHALGSLRPCCSPSSARSRHPSRQGDAESPCRADQAFTPWIGYGRGGTMTSPRECLGTTTRQPAKRDHLAPPMVRVAAGPAYPSMPAVAG